MSLPTIDVSGFGQCPRCGVRLKMGPPIETDNPQFEDCACVEGPDFLDQLLGIVVPEGKTICTSRYPRSPATYGERVFRPEELVPEQQDLYRGVGTSTAKLYLKDNKERTNHDWT